MAETFVLDCSVAAKWILPEPDRTPAMRVFERYQSGEISLIAPDLILAEFASLLAKRGRRKEISAAQASEAYRLLARCAPRLFDTRPLIPQALSLSLRHQLSLWDCLYLALAMGHKCKLLTADRRLVRGAGARHPAILSIR